MENEFKQITIDTTDIKSGAPSPAYVGATWAALVVGFFAFLIGLWNADMMLNEKGYYFTVLLFGLFSAIAVQKSVRDLLDGIPVSSLFYGISWFCVIAAILLLIIGLWNAELALSEKGFYGMSFVLSLFAAMSVQKNVRDHIAARKRAKEAEESKQESPKL